MNNNNNIPSAEASTTLHRPDLEEENTAEEIFQQHAASLNAPTEVQSPAEITFEEIAQTHANSGKQVDVELFGAKYLAAVFARWIIFAFHALAKRRRTADNNDLYNNNTAPRPSPIGAICTKATSAISGALVAAGNYPGQVINGVKQRLTAEAANGAADAMQAAVVDFNTILNTPVKELLRASCPLPSFPHSEGRAPMYGASEEPPTTGMTTKVVFGEKINLCAIGASVFPETRTMYYVSSFITPFTPEEIANMKKIATEDHLIDFDHIRHASRIAVKSGMYYYLLCKRAGKVAEKAMDAYSLCILPEEIQVPEKYKLIYISSYATEVFTHAGKHRWLAEFNKSDFSQLLAAFGLHLENFDIPLFVSGLLGVLGFNAYSIPGESTLFDVVFQVVIDMVARKHRVTVPYYVLGKVSDLGGMHTLLASALTTFPREQRQAFINGALAASAAFALPGSVEWFSTLAQAIGCSGAQISVQGVKIAPIGRSIPFLCGFIAGSIITRVNSPIDASSDYWNAIFESNQAPLLLQSAERAGCFAPRSATYLLADLDLFFKGCSLEAGRNSNNNTSNNKSQQPNSKAGKSSAALKEEQEKIKQRGKEMAEKRAAVFQKLSPTFTELNPEELGDLFATATDLSVSPKALEFGLGYKEVRKALLTSNPQVLNVLRSTLNNEKMLNQIITAIDNGNDISSDVKKGLTTQRANDFVDQGQPGAALHVPIVEISSSIRDPTPIAASRYLPTLLAYQIQTSSGKGHSSDKRSKFSRATGKAVIANYSSGHGVVEDVANDPNLKWTTEVLGEANLRWGASDGANDEDEDRNGDDDRDEQYARNNWNSPLGQDEADFTLESASSVSVPAYPQKAILRITQQGFARNNTTKIDDAPVRHQISVALTIDGEIIEHTNRSAVVRYLGHKYFLLSADVFVRSSSELGTLGTRMRESAITVYTAEGKTIAYPPSLLEEALAQVEIVSDKVIGTVFLPVCPFPNSGNAVGYSPVNRFTFGDSKAIGVALCADKVHAATIYPTNRPTVFLHDSARVAGDCGSPIWYNGQVVGIHNGYATLGAYRINFGHSAQNPTRVFSTDSGVVLQACAAAVNLDRLQQLQKVHAAHLSIHQIPKMWQAPVFDFPFSKFKRSGGPGKPENVSSSFESGNLTNAPGDLVAILAEESSSVKKHVPDPAMLTKVSDRMRTTYDKASKPYVRPGVERMDKSDRQKIIFSLLPKLCTASSAGMLYSTYQIPSSPTGRNTKKTFLAAMRASPLLREAFVTHVDYLWNSSVSSNEGFCPVPVYIKKEAMKTTKLLDGHSRTIKSPPLEIDLILAMLSFRVRTRQSLDDLLELELADVTERFANDAGVPEVDWMSPDDILYSCGPSSRARIHACAVGCDIVKVVRTMVLPEGHDKFVSLDVSGWDKSLPYPLMQALFTVFCGPGKRVDNLCRWLNRDSILVFNNHCIQQTSTSWCSGSRFTLSGNSLIHDALLNVSKFATPLLIQGDDAVVTLADNADALEEHYAKFGLVLKQATLSHETFDFCKLVVTRGQTTADLESTLNKAITSGGIPLHSLLDIASCVDHIAEASTEASPAIKRVIEFVRAVRENKVCLVKAAASLMPDDDEFAIDLVMPQPAQGEQH